jgi:hypothetical protein
MVSQGENTKFLVKPGEVCRRKAAFTEKKKSLLPRASAAALGIAVTGERENDLREFGDPYERARHSVTVGKNSVASLLCGSAKQS